MHTGCTAAAVRVEDSRGTSLPLPGSKMSAASAVTDSMTSSQMPRMLGVETARSHWLRWVGHKRSGAAIKAQSHHSLGAMINETVWMSMPRNVLVWLLRVERRNRPFRCPGSLPSTIGSCSLTSADQSQTESSQLATESCNSQSDEVGYFPGGD